MSRAAAFITDCSRDKRCDETLASVVSHIAIVQESVMSFFFHRILSVSSVINSAVLGHVLNTTVNLSDHITLSRSMPCGCHGFMHECWHAINMPRTVYVIRPLTYVLRVGIICTS